MFYYIIHVVIQFISQKTSSTNCHQKKKYIYYETCEKNLFYRTVSALR